MIVRNMRWGYDGGGLACSPVEGSTIVEICVTLNRHNYFVCASRMSDYVKITVDDYPSFDILIESNHKDVDWESEYDKLKHPIEEYDFEIGICGKLPDKIYDSKFYNAFKLVCMAMREAYEMYTFKQSDADEWIKEYVGDDLELFDLCPIEDLFCSDDDEDE